jgi:predicted deacylase
MLNFKNNQFGIISNYNTFVTKSIFMKTVYLLALVFSVLTTGLTGQINLSDSLFRHGREVYFRLANDGRLNTEQITRIISIDHKTSHDTIYAYANKKEFAEFLKLNIAFEILPHPGSLISPEMKERASIMEPNDWDFYPTYEAYVDMMYDFQNVYPDLCKVISIGQSVEGREILIARISDNIEMDEGEPSVFYTGTMHGDETTGFIVLLRLTDYLLSNAGSNQEVDNLINNLEIWINPLANPDGTYAGGNETVAGATRYNANAVDLNRNYPDPQDGPHPDGNPWQPETVAFMNFAETHHFCLAINTHGGAEVCNYPWDTWSKLHADDVWWQYVCHEYADTAQLYSPAGYLDGFNDGITNGYAWYTTNGNRQDYMNYFHQCREFTLEMSNVKLLPAGQLPALWEYNYRSLLNFMEQALFGISGVVTDFTTGSSIPAEVFVLNHDTDSSWVYALPVNGKYYRPIEAGTWDLVYKAIGYQPDTMFDVTTSNRQLTQADVTLKPGGAGMNDIQKTDDFRIISHPDKKEIVVVYSGLSEIRCSAGISSINGPVFLTANYHFNKNNNMFAMNVSELIAGVYLIVIKSGKEVYSDKFIIP